MNRTDLVKKIALRMSVTEVQARDFIHSLQGILEEEILTERTIMLLGFGTFTLWQQAERPGRNPKNGVPTVIPARNSVKFKPGKMLLEALNKK